MENFLALLLGKDSKFGIPAEIIGDAYLFAKNFGVKHFGLQCHAGSSTLDASAFTRTVKLILNSAKKIESIIGQRLNKKLALAVDLYPI